MKRILSVVLFVPLCLQAASQSDINTVKLSPEMVKQRNIMLEKQGLPIPDGGIIIKSRKELLAHTNEKMKSQFKKQRLEMQKLGYIRDSSDEIDSLLNFKSGNHSFIVAKEDPSDTNIRKNISDVKMAYEFHGIPENIVDEIIGVVPAVTFVTGSGWAGAGQFFIKNNIGTCSYVENNLKFSHGSAVISREDSTHDVNGKITTSSIKGNPSKGFLYEIDWYDNNFIREMRCAKHTFDANTIKEMIELAKQIDITA